MKKLWPLLWLTFLGMLGCSNDSEQDLMEPLPDGGENTIVTYNGNIGSIIGSNCLSCHSNPPVNGAPFALTTYTQVKNVAESGSLLAAISKQTGEPRAMPPTGRLPQATIDLVQQWIADGLLENQ
ncbi:MAG: hypothetical protein R2819_14645 [Allomuricauda sp.]